MNKIIKLKKNIKFKIIFNNNLLLNLVLNKKILTQKKVIKIMVTTKPKFFKIWNMY
jgi:hypothetical protein